MNIEQLIPKETTDRDAFIRNVIIPDESINFLGLNFQLIKFKFKTDKPLYKYHNRIEYKDMTLFNVKDGLSWAIITDDPTVFLPKEYLLEEWEVY